MPPNRPTGRSRPTLTQTRQPVRVPRLSPPSPDGPSAGSSHGATLKRPPKRLPAALWKSLPPVMRVLYITSRQRTGSWLAEAFASDSASVVELEEASGSAAGLSRLRDEVFDAVLVSHEPGELDALELIEGYRAGGADEPILVLGAQSEQEMAALCYEVGADGYICANTTTTRTLLWMVARAIQRHQLVRENRRLASPSNSAFTASTKRPTSF